MGIFIAVIGTGLVIAAFVICPVMDAIERRRLRRRALAEYLRTELQAQRAIQEIRLAGQQTRARLRQLADQPNHERRWP